MAKKGSETTQTDTISQEDAAHVRGLRGAGVDAAEAARGVSAVGLDPASQRAMQGYQNLGQQGMFRGNQMLGMGTNWMSRAGTMGFGNLSQYSSPMHEMQFGPLNEMYDRMRAGSGQDYDDQSTMAGAFGGNRSALFNLEGRDQINRQQGQHYGQLEAQNMQQAIQAMMADKQRMGNLGMGAMGLGYQGLGMASGAFGAQAGLGDYFRQVAKEGENQDFVNAQNAAAMYSGSYGKDIQRTNTTKEEKGWAEGILPAAMTIGGALLGGPAGASMGSSLAGAFGSQSPAAQGFGSQYAGNPWSGMSFGPGGGGGGVGAMAPGPTSGLFGPPVRLR